MMKYFEFKKALAYMCMRKFTNKFCQGFYSSDNSKLLREQMKVLKCLISFHDPKLAVHLNHIGVGPEMYAISWFMTHFAHVFTIDKIYHLWDIFLTGAQYMYFFVALAILSQIREDLLKAGFSEVCQY
jgi:TBC domain-containing protein kinase-like protein